MKDFLLIVGVGIACMFRWPFAPFWISRSPSSDYLALSYGARMVFILVCLLGLATELGALWGLVVQPIAGMGFMPLVAAQMLAVGFVAASVCRFIIWLLNREL